MRVQYITVTFLDVDNFLCFDYSCLTEKSGWIFNLYSCPTVLEKELQVSHLKWLSYLLIVVQNLRNNQRRSVSIQSDYSSARPLLCPLSCGFVSLAAGTSLVDAVLQAQEREQAELHIKSCLVLEFSLMKTSDWTGKEVLFERRSPYAQFLINFFNMFCYSQATIWELSCS